MIAPILHAKLDGEGCLLEGDRAFALINGAAGGDAGRPLALPALATLVRLARRLGTLISREVTFADGDREIDAWARVQPETDGLRLTLSQIRERPSGSRIALARPSAAPIGAWQWETDRAGRITFVSAGAESLEHMLGRPIDQLFRFGNGSALDEQGFSERRAAMAHNGTDVLVSAVPRLDRNGLFAGYRGAAVLAAARPTDVLGLNEVFTARLDHALRGPLGQIIANADSIHAQADGPVSEDYAGYAADIANAGRHLMALIDDLVDLEAIERPDFRIEAEPIDRGGPSARIPRDSSRCAPPMPR